MSACPAPFVALVYWVGPETVNSFRLESFLPPWVQIAPVSSQSVVGGSVIVMASLPLGWTVMVQFWLLPWVFRTADLKAQYLLAVRGYDTNAIVAAAIGQGAEPVIPPRSHRNEHRYYGRDLYRLRHLVENAFLNFNGRRQRPATQEEPPPSSPSVIFDLWSFGAN